MFPQSLTKYIVFTMQTYKKLITELYGEYTHSSFKRLDRLTNQRSRLINNLTFLKRCRDNQVVPKGLRISNASWENIKPIRLHERHATLTDYRDKKTMPRASDSYERNIMHQTDPYLR